MKSQLNSRGLEKSTFRMSRQYTVESTTSWWWIPLPRRGPLGILLAMSALMSVRVFEEAACRIEGFVRRTPLVPLQLDWKRPVYAKCENLQVAGAFKIRGAHNFISQIQPADRRCGVITYSSGNHAQAVAMSARFFRVPAVVVMPVTAPVVKVEGARSLGAEVLFEGTTSVERKARAETEASNRGLHMVPPFDDPRIVAGQGTVGLEILRDCPDLSQVLVPVGGGGLIAGIASVIKQCRPQVRVIGVEPTGAAKMTASLSAGHSVSLDRVASVADGLLPVRPGDLTFQYVRRWVDEILTVDDDSIVEAVLWLFRRAKLVVEASGAATLAALLSTTDNMGWKGSGAGATVVVLSGGNISLETLAEFSQVSTLPARRQAKAEGLGD